MTEPGTLPLTFTDKSGTIVKKVTATVVQNRRYDTSTGNITLGANDFCITVEQAKTIVSEAGSDRCCRCAKEIRKCDCN